MKKPRVTQTHGAARRSVSRSKLSHKQLFQLLPIPRGQQREHFDSAVSAYCRDFDNNKSDHQKSFETKAPMSPQFSHFRKFDNMLISKTPVWVVAQGLEIISMAIEEFCSEQIGIVGDDAYIIKCVLNGHLNEEQPVSYVNKHQPKMEFVRAEVKKLKRPLSTVITYLPASNCFYTIFAPMPRPTTGFVPLPAEWLRLTRFGSRPGDPFRAAGQPAKGAFIEEITKVFRVSSTFKSCIHTHQARHMDDYRIPLPPDWPLSDEVRKMWPTSKAARREEYYKRLMTSTKNVALGKRFVPGVLYNHLPDKKKAFVIDARCLAPNEVQVIRLVHSIDGEGHVDYQSTLRVRRLSFRQHPEFESGLRMLTRHLKYGNSNSGSVRNNHGDGYGQMYPLGTHMHNGGYAVYAKTADVPQEIMSGLMSSYRQVMATHMPYDLHAMDGHAEYHGMRPIELMGGREGVTNSINVSRNLENPPHHDIGDLGNGTSVWVEDEPGKATKWNFVCPNVLVKDPVTGYTFEGLVVKLCHGAMIDWDGLYVRHCTSMCEKGTPTNNLWGVHLTNNHPSLKEFQAKLQKECIEFEVEKEEAKQRLLQLEAKKKEAKQRLLQLEAEKKTDAVDTDAVDRHPCTSFQSARQTSEWSSPNLGVAGRHPRTSFHEGNYERTDYHAPHHQGGYSNRNDSAYNEYGNEYDNHRNHEGNYERTDYHPRHHQRGYSNRNDSAYNEYGDEYDNHRSHRSNRDYHR
jgi:hypothetical protein